TLSGIYISALNKCLTLIKGGRAGWRLPTLPELGTLFDPSVGSPGPELPDGHPFLNVQTEVNGNPSAFGLAFYWTTTGSLLAPGTTPYYTSLSFSAVAQRVNLPID